MNFLAHIFLSGHSDEIKIGNFIGDYVKGHDYEQYPELIRKGIIMHRNIDAFTDAHPTVKRSMKLFREKYRHYAGIVVDIIYDHYLSTGWSNYSIQNLEEFIEELNEILKDNFVILPQRVQNFVPRFIEHRWMQSYDNIAGIEKVLKGMSKITSLPGEYIWAREIMEKHYDVIKDHFEDYFPQLMLYIGEKYDMRYDIERLPWD